MSDKLASGPKEKIELTRQSYPTKADIENWIVDADADPTVMPIKETPAKAPA